VFRILQSKLNWSTNVQGQLLEGYLDTTVCYGSIYVFHFKHILFINK
jgi:hypothetical protein